MVVIGYGTYRNYKLQQVPDSFLAELVGRYLFSHEAQSGGDYSDLRVTIAVHEELVRRAKGGGIVPRSPSARELALKLVAKGYQSLSRDHHPDRKGGTEIAQKTLNAVREQLVRACEEIEEERVDDALTISAPVSAAITDEDIPF